MLRPDRIRQLRAEMRLTQAELAELVGVSDRAIYRYERDPVDAEASAIEGLARVFGVSTDYLLGVSDLKIEDGERIAIVALREGNAVTYMQVFVERWRK